MSVLIDSKTRVIVQGITGHHGSFHSKQMMSYGTNIVAGVTPGKGGQEIEIEEGKNIPIFNSIEDAVLEYPADYAILFVPADHALKASMEALNANLNLIIITEMIPVHDSIEIMKEASKRNLIVIGPNCPGIISPGDCKIGIMPDDIFTKGKTGVVSRSGTLTYEIVKQMSEKGFGQSSVIGIGGDMITGINLVDCVKLFNDDDETKNIVVIGEIGGSAEEMLAKYIKSNKNIKPIIAYVAGMTAPSEKRMGHAGAIIFGKSGTYKNKKEVLENAGVLVATLPDDVTKILSKL